MVAAKLSLKALMICVVVSCYNAITNVTIVGVFNYLPTENRISSYSELEHLLAFTLAVNHVNSRKDLFPNINVNFVIRSANSTESVAQVALDISRRTPKVDAVVTSLPYDSLLTLNQILVPQRIVIVNSLVHDLMTNGTTFPFMFDMTPMSSYSGFVFQSYFCRSAKRIAYVATSNSIHLNLVSEMLNKGSACGIQNLGVFVGRSGQSDFSELIESISAVAPSVLVIAMSSSEVASFLVALYQSGFLRTGITIALSDQVDVGSLLLSLPNNVDVKKLLFGSIRIEFWPDFSLTRLPEGISFVNRWKSQQSSLYNCSGYIDADSYQYLTLEGKCLGIDYAAYNDSQSINKYIAYTYDAVLALTHGLSTLVSKGNPINGVNLRASMLSSSFLGVSGLVGFRQGNPSNNMYGQGNRGMGVYFKISNFLPSLYLNQSSQPFAGVYAINSENELQPCDAVLNYGSCTTLSLNTPDRVITGYAPYTKESLPSVLKIGALFSPVDSDGSVNIEQVEMLAAFKIAVDSINNDLHILPGTKILFELKTGQGFVNSLANAGDLVNGFSGSGVIAVVSGLDDVDTITTHNVFTNNHNIFQINAVSRISKLSDGASIPYKANLHPVYSYDGSVMQSVLCNNFGYKHIGLFYTDDVEGINTRSELLNELYCTLSVEFEYEIDLKSSVVDYASVFSSAKTSGTTIFVVLISNSMAARWLYEGYQRGVFVQGTLLFLSSVSRVNIIETLHTIIPAYSTAVVSDIMKGVLSLDYWPDRSFRRTEKGRAFIDQWKNQPYTGPHTFAGKTVCNRTTDSAGTTFLYQNSGGTICSGLNYSSYDELLSGLSPSALAVYDAVLGLGYAVDRILSANDSIHFISGEELRSVLVNNMSYEGLTDFIDFDNGDEHQSYKWRGDRRVGLTYKILQYDWNYFAENLHSRFGQIGVWKSDGLMYESCESWMNCSLTIYNSAVNTPPSDTQSDLYITMPVAGIAVIALVFSVGVSVTVASIGLSITNRDHKLFHAAQPEMLFSILIGSLLGLGRLLLSVFHITDQSCTLGLWLAHLGFASAIGGLIIKVYGVHTVLTAKNFKRVKFTSTQAVSCMSVIVFITLVILIVLTVASQPRVSYDQSTKNNQTTKRAVCRLLYPNLHVAVMIVEAVFFAFGMRLCISVNSTQNALHEFKRIAIIMMIVGFIAVLVFPVVFLLNIEPINRQIIASLGIGLSSIAIVSILFIPKFYKIKTGNKTIDIFHADKVSEAPTSTSFDSTRQALQIIKTLSDDAKVAFCANQILKWQSLLVSLDDLSSSDKRQSKLSKLTANVPETRPNEVTAAIQLHKQPSIEEIVANSSV